VLAILSAGAALVARMLSFGISQVEALTLSLGLGTVIVAYGVLALGLLGLLHRTAFYLWLGFATLSVSPS
jgi:hypothetical protein